MGHDVFVVADQELSEERRALGWPVPKFGAARVLVTRDQIAISDVIKDLGKDTIHVVVGVRDSVNGYTALKTCIRQGVRIGFMSEAAQWHGLLGHVRRMVHVKDRLRFGGRFDFVLAMGQNGVDWFRSCGYPSEKLFLYGYAAEDPGVPLPSQGSEHVRPSEVVFIGRFLRCKGVPLLLRALSECADLDWHLTFIGDGPQNIPWQEMASGLAVGHRVQFRAPLPHAEAMRLLADADLLVLPSETPEGWGVVVNEALMLGVPVVCTTVCGAKDLVCNDWLGSVVANGSVDALRAALRRWISSSTRDDMARSRIRSWSDHISGERMAQYLVDVLCHVYGRARRPRPPWSELESDSVSRCQSGLCQTG